MMGCSLAADQVLPAPLESLVTSNGSADDHMMAPPSTSKRPNGSKLRRPNMNRRLRQSNPSQDPKGFRRNGLLAAAQRNRTQAAEMQQLYAAHHTKAQTLTGKQQLQ